MIMKKMMIMCVFVCECLCVFLSVNVCVHVCACVCVHQQMAQKTKLKRGWPGLLMDTQFAMQCHHVYSTCILYFAVLLCSYTPFLHIYTLLAVLLYSLLLYRGIRTTTLWPSSFSSGMWMVTLVKCVAVVKQNWVKQDHVTSWYIGLGFCCFWNVKLL